MKSFKFNAGQYCPGELQRRQRIRRTRGEASTAFLAFQALRNALTSPNLRNKHRLRFWRANRCGMLWRRRNRKIGVDCVPGVRIVARPLVSGKSTERASSVLLVFKALRAISYRQSREQRRQRSAYKSLRDASAAPNHRTGAITFRAFKSLRALSYPAKPRRNRRRCFWRANRCVTLRRRRIRGQARQDSGRANPQTGADNVLAFKALPPPRADNPRSIRRRRLALESLRNALTSPNLRNKHRPRFWRANRCGMLRRRRTRKIGVDCVPNVKSVARRLASPNPRSKRRRCSYIRIVARRFGVDQSADRRRQRFWRANRCDRIAPGVPRSRRRRRS